MTKAESVSTTKRPNLHVIAEPSPWGRKVLELIQEDRRLAATYPDQAADPIAFARHEKRVLAHGAKIDRMCRDIVDRPVLSMSDVADRLIGAVWFHDSPGDALAMVIGLLAIAGIEPEQCGCSRERAIGQRWALCAA